MMKLKTEKKYRLRNVVDYLGDKTKRIQIRKNLFWWTKYTQKKSNTLILKDGQKIHLKRWVQHEKDFLKAYLKKFDTEEVEVLRQVYQELSSRNPGIGIDKETFLQYFPLPGLWGERLFYRFDYKCLNAIDYEEFLVGIAVCCRGTKYERINVLFQIFDLNDDGMLQKEELVAMLSNLPHLDCYVNQKTFQDLSVKDTSKFTSFQQVSPKHEFSDQCCSGRNSELYLQVPKNPISLKKWGNEGEETRITAILPEVFEKPKDQICRSETFGSSTTEVIKGKNGQLMTTCAPKNCPIDVEALVDEIIEECEFSENNTLTFIEFKTWLERNELILSLFTECLHEEVWGLQGIALYRRHNRTLMFRKNCRHQDDKKWRCNENIFTHSHIEKSPRGYIKIQPDVFFKIKQLFTVTICRAFSTFPDNQGVSYVNSNCTTGQLSQKYWKCIYTLLSEKSALPICNMLPFLNTYDQHSHKGSTTSTVCLPRARHKRIKESTPKQQFHVDMSHIYGASSSHVTDEEQCLFTCPHCHVLLIVCPRCQRSVSSLELFHGDIVVECLNCLDNLPHRFHSCWHCHWNFSKAIEMIDSTTPLHEGFLYKLGRKSHTWKRRYFVLVENLLYYYKEKEDTKPLGFFFLQDCFIDSMDQIQGVSSCLLPKKDDLEQRDAIKSMNAKTKQVSNKSKWLDVCRERISTTLQLPLCVNNHFNALCSSFLSRNVKNKCRFSITHESGQIPSREFYTDTLEERGVWLKALLLAMHQDLVTDFYDIHQVVGQGKFSVVHCAYPLDTSRSHEPVAVKVIERKKMTNQQHQLLRSEISILRLLRHPHVIQFRQIFTSPTHIYIVMEYVKGGELSELFQKKRFLHESHVNRIIYQLLSTIAYLHKCGIIHRDIKPENILLTDTSNDDADIKITDFGLSCICGPSEYVTQPCGTLAYVAPEILNLQGYNHKVDVWSVGIIMYLLLRGRLPFPIHQIKPYAQHDSLKVKDNKSQKHLKTHNTANFTQLFSLKFSGPIWDNVSSSAKDLLRKLLQPDPRKRISAQDALEHIWIKNPTAVITESIVENTFFPPSSEDQTIPTLTEKSNLVNVNVFHQVTFYTSQMILLRYL